MGFRIDPIAALKGTSEAQLRMMFAVEKYGQAAAAKLEAKAKADAPWTDRTGLARQTITGVSDWVGEGLRVGIAGNMHYSTYLEFKNDGRFAVLWPTLNGMSAEILQGMANLIG